MMHTKAFPRIPLHVPATEILPLIFAVQFAAAEPQKTDRADPGKVGSSDVATVLVLLGADMENGLTLQQLENYTRQFERGDQNGDGKHSKAEFIDGGTYLTPQARRGIFYAADNDKDGFVTRCEYILNRVITDEAKSIVQAMDENKDGAVQRDEFLKNVDLDDRSEALATGVFSALDTNADLEIVVPEYLRVWGKWARLGRESAEARISARETELNADPPNAEKER